MHFGKHAEGCSPLVDPLDGGGNQPVTYHDLPHLERLWAAAAPRGNLQAVHRPAVRPLSAMQASSAGQRTRCRTWPASTCHRRTGLSCCGIDEKSQIQTLDREQSVLP